MFNTAKIKCALSLSIPEHFGSKINVISTFSEMRICFQMVFSVLLDPVNIALYRERSAQSRFRAILLLHFLVLYHLYFALKYKYKGSSPKEKHDFCDIVTK